MKFFEDNCSNSIKAVNELIVLDSRQTSSRPLQESPIEEKEAAAKDASEAGSLTLPQINCIVQDIVSPIIDI